MIRIERHIITKTHYNWKKIDNLCFLFKNLYNYVNYLLRQNYFENRKKDKNSRCWINKYELVKKLINADVNGAINILRKVIDDDFVKNLINKGCGYQPIRISI